MTNCTQEVFSFPSLGKRKVEGQFGGGHVSSDGGALLLRLIDNRLGLTKALARVMPDGRQQAKVVHAMGDLLCQRIYGLALGYEDLNDHATLRGDLVLQTAVGTEDDLASPSTAQRLESKAGRAAAWAMHKVFLDQFIARFKSAPRELVLDFDATDDRVHGQQEGRFYHGYYGDYCFLPLYVFCGEQLLVSYLRPSNQDAATHTGAILKLLVTALRKVWPKVKIILRADSGFCRHHLFSWCRRKGVDYLIGLAKNQRLEKLSAPLLEQAKAQYEATHEKARLFTDLRYAAGTWKHEERVIAKVEHTADGPNPRYVVTSLEGKAQELYDQVFCRRGEMENRIKEQQLGLFADRTSSHKWWANQFRLLLSSCAYLLVEGLRRLALTGTELAHAQAGTIRLKLLKIGTVITRNTRTIRLRFTSRYPYQTLFAQVVARLTG